ncbi:hypothetical protein B296_00002413 [Ensete ventricosum]|uniref:Uncharacterized protein n=1 Tax=Ensete ventricosum TaxID=4639 RepID=A0A427B8I8_ENSVE|nr:hypothetical protein B296_00002413 [Ensete ventricosum]
MPLRQLNHRTRPPTEPSSFLPIEETSTPAPTPNRYRRLLNDPGFSPPVANPGPPPVSVEAFFGLTHQRLEEELRFPQTKDTPENSNASIAQLASRSRDVVRALPDPDIVSSDSTDSVREQLRLVNQRLDEVRKDFAKSKEEVGESSKAESPFVPEIQDEPVPHGFRLSRWNITTVARTPWSTLRPSEPKWPSTTLLTLSCAEPSRQL